MRTIIGPQKIKLLLRHVSDRLIGPISYFVYFLFVGGEVSNFNQVVTVYIWKVQKFLVGSLDKSENYVKYKGK